MAMPKTIHKGYLEHKKQNPDSDLTEYALRQFIISGQIPSVKSGNRFLFTLENLDAFLNGTLPGQNSESNEVNGIRRISP